MSVTDTFRKISVIVTGKLNNNRGKVGTMKYYSKQKVPLSAGIIGNYNIKHVIRIKNRQSVYITKNFIK